MLIKNKIRRSTRCFEDGFSLIEVLIVMLILAILTTITLMGIVQARSSFQFSNAVTSLQTHLERALSDAKRRNAKGDARATVRVLSPRSYQVKIDFDGDGNSETQTIELPPQTSFLYDSGSPPQATIDWRGNIAEGNVTFVLKSDDGQISEVKLTNRGDSSTNAEFPVLPTVSVTPMSADVKASTVLVGNTTFNPHASPTPTPTPLPVCTNVQMPAVHNCRCQSGKTIDSKSGKCK